MSALSIPVLERFDPTAASATGLPVIVFGAGVVGQLLVHALRGMGIDVACFADNSTAKAGSRLCELEVVPAASLPLRFADALFVISAADIQDIVFQLRQTGYARCFAGADVLRNLDWSAFPVDAPADFVEFAAGACLQCQDAYLHPDKLFFRSVDIIITERCSLKCRDCSNLMQYYERPQNVELDEIVRSIDAFCTVVDDIHEFRVIGGEPFMNKHYPMVVRHLSAKRNVKRIVIYTNGTIVPKGEQLESLKHAKVMILLTDYGPLSPKATELKAVLKNNGIGFFARPADGWSECASIEPHGRNAEEQRALFASCCAKNLHTLSGGKLYRCPFVANAVRLGAIPDYAHDHVNVLAAAHEGEEAVRQQIRKLLAVDHLESCDFCAGRPLNAPTVTPAVQTETPLAYVKAIRSLMPVVGLSSRSPKASGE